MGHKSSTKTVFFLVLAATVALLAWIVWGSFHDPEAMWAPGNLRQAHAQVASCTACHEPFYGPSAAHCLACHSEESFVRRATTEIGQRHVAAIREHRSCLSCHTEHQGR